MVTLTGTISDGNGNYPVSGTIEFELDSSIESGAVAYIPGAIIGNIATDGSFSISIQPTLPGSAKYLVSVDARFSDGRSIKTYLGDIKIPNSNQTLSALLAGIKNQGDVWNETPTGACDGQNRIFQISLQQATGSEQIYVNGLKISPDNYKITSSGRISFKTPPKSNDQVRAYYVRADQYDLDVDMRVFQEKLTFVSGSSYSFKNPLEPGTEEIFVGSNFQTPDVSYIIDSSGNVTFLDTAPVSPPYGWYNKAEQ